MNKIDQPKFYTTEEVAGMLKVKPESVRRYVRSGRLRAIKLGGKFIRIDHWDFEEFIEKLKTNPQKGE
jgi:excisionase family DNA binding protein